MQHIERLYNAEKETDSPKKVLGIKKKKKPAKSENTKTVKEKVTSIRGTKPKGETILDNKDKTEE